MKMRLVCLFFLLISATVAISAGPCFEKAAIVAPVLSDEARQTLEKRRTEAKLLAEREPKNPDALIWFGRRTAYLGEYREAIRIFSRGAKLFPTDARFLRHRGHRLITVRCFDDAIRDFRLAAKLTEGKPDEVEPDGMPNQRNIPTSTLQTNIYYHLGLAYYVKGNFKKALQAYVVCEKLSRNADMLIATKHWIYMTLRRLGRGAEATAAVADIAPDLDIIENDDYYKLIKVYQGKLKPEETFSGKTNALGDASIGYGVGNWYFYIGETEKGIDVFRRIVAGNQWASFGYIAAEAELARKSK